MSVTLEVHQVRKIVRKNLTGNRLKSFSSIPSGGRGAFVLHLRRRPFKVILKVLEGDRSSALKVEREVERILKGMKGVRVSEFIDLDESREIVPFGYYLKSYLPGLPWADVMSLLPASDGLALARRCGEMLGIYHGVGASRFGEIGEEAESSAWIPFILDRAMAGLDRVIDRRLIGRRDGREIRERLIASRDLLDLVGGPQLTHRRLTFEDILVENEGGEWIATGVLGTGRSAMWNHVWDMASLARQIGDDRPDLLAAFEDSHYGVISRPDAYGERLDLYGILEALDGLDRAGEDEGTKGRLLEKIMKGVGG